MSGIFGITAAVAAGTTVFTYARSTNKLVAEKNGMGFTPMDRSNRGYNATLGVLAVAGSYAVPWNKTGGAQAVRGIGIGLLAGTALAELTG